MVCAKGYAWKTFKELGGVLQGKQWFVFEVAWQSNLGWGKELN